MVPKSPQHIPVLHLLALNPRRSIDRDDKELVSSWAPELRVSTPSGHWLLAKEIDRTPDALPAGHVDCGHFDLRSSERHPGLYLAGSCSRRAGVGGRGRTGDGSGWW